MRALRPDWSLESINTKIKQLRRGAPDQSRPLKRRRTSEVLAEIERAVTETPRQTLSVLRRHSSLDMSRSTLWRALFLWVSALEALAWTSALATDCDHESRLRKSMSVCCLSLPPFLSLSLFLSFSVPLLSLFLSLCVSLSPSLSPSHHPLPHPPLHPHPHPPFPHHHHFIRR